MTRCFQNFTICSQVTLLEFFPLPLLVILILLYVKCHSSYINYIATNNSVALSSQAGYCDCIENFTSCQPNVTDNETTTPTSCSNDTCLKGGSCIQIGASNNTCNCTDGELVRVSNCKAWEQGDTCLISGKYWYIYQPVLSIVGLMIVTIMVVVMIMIVAMIKYLISI